MATPKASKAVEGQLVPKPPAPVVKTDAEKRLERLQQIQAAIAEEAIELASFQFRFAEVTPDQKDPPEEWIQELGYAKAHKALIVAKMGWQNQSNAPVALKHATQIAMGAMRAMSVSQGRQTTLNVALVQMPAPDAKSEKFPSLVLER